MASSTGNTRVAIVTGAAQGLGYAIALRLADDGLDVAVNDIGSKSDKLKGVVKEIQAKGRRALAFPGDMTVENEVKGLVNKTVEVLGGVDCMIANAGTARAVPFLESTVEDFDRLYAINVRSIMLCYKYAALQMVKQGRGGRLIGASSASGREGTPLMSAYSASKFAVRGLTQSVAVELCKHKITVNCYAPGGINTPLAGETLTQFGDQTALLNMPPHVVMGEPEVIASITSYLCKPEAYFITGQTISVDGGLKLS